MDDKNFLYMVCVDATYAERTAYELITQLKNHI